MNGAVVDKLSRAQVHCPICTHTVPAAVDLSLKRPRIVPGQKCPRCAAKLDAAYVLEVLQAA